MDDICADVSTHIRPYMVTEHDAHTLPVNTAHAWAASVCVGVCAFVGALAPVHVCLCACICVCVSVSVYVYVFVRARVACLCVCVSACVSLKLNSCRIMISIMHPMVLI